jgi:hypothetical protein
LNIVTKSKQPSFSLTLQELPVVRKVDAVQPFGLCWRTRLDWAASNSRVTRAVFSADWRGKKECSENRPENAAFPNSPERADVHALLTVLVAGKKATDFVFTRKTANRKSMISGINC